MSVLEVVHYGDPILRKKCEPLEKVDDDVRKLLQEMLETMYEAACKANPSGTISTPSTSTGGDTIIGEASASSTD